MRARGARRHGRERARTGSTSAEAEVRHFSRSASPATKHRRVNHNQKEWVNGQIHTNTVESVWGLFDRSVIGAYHKLSVKHLPAYLGEAAFRWNNRNNAFLFRDTILRLVEGDALTFRELVDAR